MNIKDLLGPLLLATGLVLLSRSAVQYFWPSGQDKGAFTAPLSTQEQEPLRLEVDFLDTEKDTEEKLETIKTPHGTYIFSNHGASLKNLDFYRDQHGTKQLFNTIGSQSHRERETRAFLIALDQKTPYYYTHKKTTETDATGTVVYTVKTETATIEKTFVVDKEKYKMDVIVKVTPAQGATVRPRLIFPSPYLQVLGKADFTNAFAIDRSGVFSKRGQARIDQRAGYFTPQTFGTEDKYFVHSMIEDVDKFARRAYYKVIDQQTSSFLEASEVTKETTWKVSFYMGPKTGSAINPVAPQLDQTLDYGFLSPLTKGALYLLNLINKYVGNYGWAIVIVTLLFKLLLLPFSLSGHKKMQKMQEFQRELQYIRQKYKDNPEMAQRMEQDLIREKGMPGLAGCLPMLLQVPMFWVLNAALNNSIELYRAPFVFWIKDLSLPDPYYVLPLLGALGLFVSMTTSDKKMTAKQVMVFVAVALVIFAFTSSMAAGLALFFVVNGILHAGQMKLQKAIG